MKVFVMALRSMSVPRGSEGMLPRKILTIDTLSCILVGLK